MNARSAAILTIGLAMGCAEDETTTSPSPPGCEPADHVLVCGRGLNIAHRGGARLAPENTLAAFANAESIGVDALELDVHATSDGVVVVMHDEDVDRTTDGTGSIKDMTFDELRMLDAGYRFSPDGGDTFPYRGQGVVVPTLEEVATTFARLPLAIEIKQAQPRINEAVIAALASAQATERSQIASFFDDVLLELRADHPEVPTSMGAAEIIEFVTLTDDEEEAYVAPAPVIQAPKASVDAAFMARALREGVTVHAWTVNDTAEMQVFIDLDVHGVMTDDPAALEELME